MSRIRSYRPSPAMIVALVALVVATAGTASGLPGRHRVKADDLAQNAVHTKSIANKAVTRSKIAQKAIDSSRIGKDALLGTNILESSLSKVPDADKLDGVDSSGFVSTNNVKKISTFALANGQTKDVYRSGALSLTARCTINSAGIDTAEILIATAQDNAAFDGDDTDADLDTGDAEAGRQFVVATGAAGTPQFRGVADGVAIAPDGSEINGAALWAGVNVLGNGGQCRFGGYILV